MKSTVTGWGKDIASAKENALKVLRTGGIDISPSRIEWTDAEPNVEWTYGDGTRVTSWEVTGEYDFG